MKIKNSFFCVKRPEITKAAWIQGFCRIGKTFGVQQLDQLTTQKAHESDDRISIRSISAVEPTRDD